MALENPIKLKILILVMFLMTGIAIVKGNDNIQHIQPPLDPHIVFLISEDPLNYEAHKTIPPFAKVLKEKHGFKVTVLLGSGKHGAYQFPEMDIINEADLVVVFCRRLALPHHQMDILKKHLKSGKPIVGIRTANHGFSVRDEVSNGYEGWWGFVPDILGCKNQGYEPEEFGTEVTIVPGKADHPILKDVAISGWYSNGQVYKVAPIIDKKAEVFLTGQARNNSGPQPIAWTRETAYKGRVFYTSLGYPDDFKFAPFKQLLINGIHWALNLDPL
jgi:type 1 glutamine amidotransferase